jgi:hypothetical protein
MAARIYLKIVNITSGWNLLMPAILEIKFQFIEEKFH